MNLSLSIYIQFFSSRHFVFSYATLVDEADTGEKKGWSPRPGSSGWKSLLESAFGVERVARRAFPSQGIVSVDNNGRTVFQQGITHGECIYTVVKVSRPKTASG